MAQGKSLGRWRKAGRPPGTSRARAARAMLCWRAGPEGREPKEPKEGRETPCSGQGRDQAAQHVPAAQGGPGCIGRAPAAWPCSYGPSRSSWWPAPQGWPPALRPAAFLAFTPQLCLPLLAALRRRKAGHQPCGGARQRGSQERRGQRKAKRRPGKTRPEEGKEAARKEAARGRQRGGQEARPPGTSRAGHMTLGGLGGGQQRVWGGGQQRGGQSPHAPSFDCSQPPAYPSHRNSIPCAKTLDPPRA